MLFLLFLLCAICLWLCNSYVTVIKKREEAYDCFERVANELKKRSSLITDIILSTDKYLLSHQPLINSIKILQKEVLELGLEPEFMNRRIALDKELENKSNQLINIIKEDTELFQLVSNSIKIYFELNEYIHMVKQDYNSAAESFRKAVDVFPSSFMARLKNIKSIDYMK